MLRRPGAVGRQFPVGLIVVAVLMIVFGLAEIATGFTHNFLGIISTAKLAPSTYAAAGIGAIYAICGLLILTRKKRAAMLAIACLIIVVLGRVSMVLTGLYPVNSFLQIVSIGIGTSIAIVFAAYIWLKRSSFG